MYREDQTRGQMPIDLSHCCVRICHIVGCIMMPVISDVELFDCSRPVTGVVSGQVVKILIS